jgi:hypothetical protein
VQFFGRERKRFELGDGEKGLDLIDLHVISDLVVPSIAIPAPLFLKGMEIMKIMN